MSVAGGGSGARSVVLVVVAVVELNHLHFPLSHCGVEHFSASLQAKMFKLERRTPLSRSTLLQSFSTSTLCTAMQMPEGQATQMHGVVMKMVLRAVGRGQGAG